VLQALATICVLLARGEQFHSVSPVALTEALRVASACDYLRSTYRVEQVHCISEGTD